jgi:hypothetical protein
MENNRKGEKCLLSLLSSKYRSKSLVLSNSSKSLAIPETKRKEKGENEENEENKQKDFYFLSLQFRDKCGPTLRMKVVLV